MQDNGFGMASVAAELFSSFFSLLYKFQAGIYLSSAGKFLGKAGVI
jgi:hypothetical protein